MSAFRWLLSAVRSPLSAVRWLLSAYTRERSAMGSLTNQEPGTKNSPRPGHRQPPRLTGTAPGRMLVAMDVRSFLTHHQLQVNPFDAEEARHDRVFSELMDERTAHPDFHKVLGQVDRPSSAVVFGEKGSGKTAIRLMIGQKVDEHNKAHPERRTFMVAYDDLNPVLDRLALQQGKRDKGHGSAVELPEIRLEDHQDAILSLAVTRLADALLATHRPGEGPLPLPEDAPKRLRHLPRQLRLSLAVLAALYDQPGSGAAVSRWQALRAKLRLGWTLPLGWLRYLAILLSVAAVGLARAHYVLRWAEQGQWLETGPGGWELPTAIAAAAGGLACWGAWLWQHLRLLRQSWRIRREMPAIGRTMRELRTMLGQLPRRELASEPLPEPGVGSREARYQLTHRLLSILQPLGYVSLLVLIDRVDEPTLITGRAERMQQVIWPMFDNKFLQQEGVGLKLLLPIELRRALFRESPEFFQEARLDKQHLVDRLSWSGAVLYDLCSRRLRACRGVEEDFYLTDLFDEDVSRDLLVDALDQMHQPRDAFKFLYQVIQEHCRMVPDDQAKFLIPRLTLEAVRRQQAQRVQELQRGLTPA